MKSSTKTKNWRNLFIWGALGSILTIVSTIFGVGVYIVNTLTRPKRLQSLQDIFTFSPFEVGLPAEDVTFAPSKGDHLVSAWFAPHPDATITIIVSPGYRGQRADMLGISRQLWKAGYNVLVLEYYGHGSIVGKPVTLGYRELDDFLGAVRYIRERLPDTRLGAIGYSMGGSITLMGSVQVPEIEVIVADSPFATHRSVLALAFNQKIPLLPFKIFEWAVDLNLKRRAGYHLRDVEPLRYVSQLKRPLFLIHGQSDSIVPHHDGELLFAQAAEPKEFWSLPNTEHCGAYFEDRPYYIKRVLGFFANHFEQSAAQKTRQSS